MFCIEVTTFGIKAQDKHVKFSFHVFFFPLSFQYTHFLFVLRSFFSWADVGWENYSLYITWEGTYEGTPFSVRGTVVLVVHLDVGEEMHCNRQTVGELP